MIDGSISGLAPGLHGIHVHIFGDFSQGLTSAGGIFNPFARNHGGPNDEERMAGDLGNLEVAEDGSCSVHIEDRHVKLIGPHSIIGRSIVVFGGEDDFGKGGHELSLSTGNPGPRVAGGVQRRSDYACTSLKLLAWNLTEYDKVLMADTDVFFMEDPLPWLRRQWHLTFAATNELMNVNEMADEGRVSARGYHGLNTHLVLLTPSTVVLELLLDLATTGSFVPYTNSEQDVIETLFASNRVQAPLPAHWHSPHIREAACEPVRGVSGAPAEVERRALAACNATCRRP